MYCIYIKVLTIYIEIIFTSLNAEKFRKTTVLLRKNYCCLKMIRLCIIYTLQVEKEKTCKTT